MLNINDTSMIHDTVFFLEPGTGTWEAIAPPAPTFFKNPFFLKQNVTVFLQGFHRTAEPEHFLKKNAEPEQLL